MTQVVMRAIKIGGEQNERVFALAMCCQPTTAQWAEFEANMAYVRAFTVVGRKGGLVKVRLVEGLDWESQVKRGDYSCRAADMPGKIMQDIIAPPRVTA